jgi:hypothetical protein
MRAALTPIRVAADTAEHVEGQFSPRRAVFFIAAASFVGWSAVVWVASHMI